MKTLVILLTCASLIAPSLSYADDDYYDEYEDFNPLEYSYQYSDAPVTNFRGYYRQNPNQDDACDTAGCGYFNSCRASQLTVGVAIGAAMIIAIVAVVAEDGSSAHCH